MSAKQETPIPTSTMLDEVLKVIDSLEEQDLMYVPPRFLLKLLGQQRMVNSSQIEGKALIFDVTDPNSHGKEPELNPKDTVTFVVGASKPQISTIDKDKAVTSSPVFKAAFAGNYLEAQTLSMRLDDVDPNIFLDLHHWMTTEKLKFKGDDEKALIPYTRLWLLADRFLMAELQEQAFKTVEGIIAITLPSNLERFIEFVYSSSEMTPFKNLIAMRLSRVHSASELRDVVRGWGEELATDVMMKIWESKEEGLERISRLERNMIGMAQDFERSISTYQSADGGLQGSSFRAERARAVANEATSAVPRNA